MHILYTLCIYTCHLDHVMSFINRVCSIKPGWFQILPSLIQGPFNPWHQGSRVSWFRNWKHPGESDFRLFSGKSWVQWFRLQSDMFKTSWVSNSKPHLDATFTPIQTAGCEAITASDSRFAGTFCRCAHYIDCWTRLGWDHLQWWSGVPGQLKEVNLQELQ